MGPKKIDPTRIPAGNKEVITPASIFPTPNLLTISGNTEPTDTATIPKRHKHRQAAIKTRFSLYIEGNVFGYSASAQDRKDWGISSKIVGIFKMPAIYVLMFALIDGQFEVANQFVTTTPESN